jgi:hypothetical protein
MRERKNPSPGTASAYWQRRSVTSGLSATFPSNAFTMRAATTRLIFWKHGKAFHPITCQLSADVCIDNVNLIF